MLFVVMSYVLTAQEINPTEVTVIEGFIPVIPESEKIKEIIKFQDTSVVDKIQDYRFIDKILSSKYKGRILKSATLVGEKKSDLIRFNSTLGIGFKHTLLAKLNLNSLINNEYSYGLSVDHLSNKYSVESVPFGSYDNTHKGSFSNLNVFFKKVGENSISFMNFDYDRILVDNSFTYLLLNEEEFYFNKNRFSYSKLGIVTYSQGLSLNKWRYKTNLFISDLNEFSENKIHLSSKLEKNIKDIPFSLQLVYDNYLNYSNSDEENGREKSNLKEFDILPSFIFNRNGLNIDLNILFRYDIDVLGESNYSWFPQLRLMKNLVKNILFLEGGIRHFDKRITVKTLSEENPYIYAFGTNQKNEVNSVSTLDLKTTDIDEVYLEMRNMLAKDEFFSGCISYGKITNIQSFILFLDPINNINQFLSHYQDTWRLHVNTFYKKKMNEIIEINVSLNYLNYSSSIPNKEKLNGNLKFIFNLDDKIKMNSSISYLGKRTSGTQISNETYGFNVNPDYLISELNQQIHFDISIDYNYTKSINSYIRINNIFNSKEELWQGYQEIGRNVWFGLGYSF